MARFAWCRAHPSSASTRVGDSDTPRTDLNRHTNHERGPLTAPWCCVWAQMAFQGTLYITDRHTCFVVEERGRKVPFKVPHSQVSKVTRQRPARKGGAWG